MIAWPAAGLWGVRRLVPDVRSEAVRQRYQLRPLMVWLVLGMATLWMAIAADMGASLLVILNGLRLLEPGAPPDKNGVCLHSPPTASRASVGAKNHVCDGRCDGR